MGSKKESIYNTIQKIDEQEATRLEKDVGYTYKHTIRTEDQTYFVLNSVINNMSYQLTKMNEETMVMFSKSDYDGTHALMYLNNGEIKKLIHAIFGYVDMYFTESQISDISDSLKVIANREDK